MGLVLKQETTARSNRVKMISPTIAASEAGKMCFSFWFAAFGAGETTSLKIYKYEGEAVDRMDKDHHDFHRQDISEGKDEDEDKAIPSLWELSAAALDTARPEWQSGQVREGGATPPRWPWT